ncbi:glycerate kinase [Campylobacter concisus]|uniref:glycerate kinase family protein n=1 Tax=Campylobacter concisus TaxID=199 RepID=UPI000B3D63F9|nr:glycerate kinase [Campylobacter concisus]OUT07559.1 glycerate kinase [Campylobacter concisus]
MRILVAIDSLKGSLSSLEAGLAIKEGLEEIGCEVVVKPIADGGEGSVEAMADALGAKFIDTIVKNPLGTEILARYALKDDLAILEMSSASGLTLINPDERNPLKTSTFGFGQMIKDAISKGARKFIIGIGGSATNDAGTGMLSALGFNFYDKNGILLEGKGEDLAKICEFSDENVSKELRECEFLIACDVDNPLYGTNGAAHVYAPQKGANGRMVKELDDGLKHFASLVKEKNGTKFHTQKGAGAAGGLGFAFVAFLGAKLRPGIEIITQTIALEDEIKKADLVITGEGRMDFQSSMGKTPTGVAKLAKKHNKPVVALAGCVQKCAKDCYKNGIDAYFCILNEPVSLEEAMRKDVAIRNLKMTAEQVIRLYILNHKV